MITMLQNANPVTNQDGTPLERLRKHYDPAEVGPDNLPKDWGQDIVWRGMARVNVSKCYNVRLSVQGVQYFITSAWSQHSAASLYDLALWKLCPKIGRKFTPNFPDDFDGICQLDVDAECPTLNPLFNQLPFLTSDDEKLGEFELRARILNREPSPSQMLKTRSNRQFIDALIAMKKISAQSVSNQKEAESRRLSLVALHKLPAIVELFRSVELSLQQSVNQSKLLEELMEKSATYYGKLVAESEGLSA